MLQKLAGYLKPPGLSAWRQKSLLAVAFMSFCWSTSSLMVFSVLPAFLVDELGTSHIKIGIMEGVAIFLAFAAKVVTGICSDMWQTRKPFILFGTIFTVITKCLFVAATNIYFVFFARFIDRIAKGVRSAPTDALLADIGTKKNYGSVFGIRQALYTLGGVCGALAASICMLASHNSYRVVFIVAVIPALISLWICISFITNPSPEKDNGKNKKLWNVKDIHLLPKEFWFLLIITLFIMVARFSEAFLTLRAKELSWPLAMLPVLIIIMDLVHAGVALLCGSWESKFSKQFLLLIGMVFFIAANIILALATNGFFVVSGFILVGVHMGITQGLLRALIAESTPAHLRGTAYALFYLVSGIAVLAGNGAAGFCADSYGLFSVFIFGGSFTCISFLLCSALLLRRKKYITAVSDALATN